MLRGVSATYITNRFMFVVYWCFPEPCTPSANQAQHSTPLRGPLTPTLSRTQEYGSDDYWRRRYAAGVEHEWYCPPKILLQLLPSPPGHMNAAERMAAEMSGIRPKRPTARALVLGSSPPPYTFNANRNE